MADESTESTQAVKAPKAAKATKAPKQAVPTPEVAAQEATAAQQEPAQVKPQGASGTASARPARKSRQSGPRSQAFLTHNTTLNSFHAQQVYDRSFKIGDEALYTLSVVLRVLATEDKCTEVEEIVNKKLEEVRKLVVDEATRLEKLAETYGISGSGMTYSQPMAVSAKLTSPRASSWINLIRDYDKLVEAFDVLWMSHVISDSDHSKGIFNVKRRLMRCANDMRTLAIRSIAAAQKGGDQNVPSDPRAGTALDADANKPAAEPVADAAQAKTEEVAAEDLAGSQVEELAEAVAA